MSELKPCPFCGGEAEVERRGTSRQSCIIACTECGCRHEGPDEYEQCGYQWNMRVTDQAYAAKTKAEEAELGAAQELDEVKAERDALAAALADIRFAASVEAPGFLPAIKQYISEHAAPPRRQAEEPTE